jgi:hypothetical protein
MKIQFQKSAKMLPVFCFKNGLEIKMAVYSVVLIGS